METEKTNDANLLWILKSKIFSDALLEYLKACFCEETLLFWIAADAFSSEVESNQMITTASEIFQTYVGTKH